MMCYKDRAWCAMSDICETTECDRKFTKEDDKRATTWWGDKTYPVAMSDFSDTCGKFEATQVVEHNKLKEEK